MTTTRTNIVTMAKQANKSLLETINTVDTNASDITVTLHTIASNKAIIKQVQADNKSLIVVALKQVNDYINALKSENDLFKGLKNSQLIQTVKYRLDSKDTTINVVCDYLENNITINYALSVSELKYLLKLLKSGTISKSTFKKDTDALKEIVTTNRKMEQLSNAKKLVNNSVK
jgi:hypothetical protein